VQQVSTRPQSPGEAATDVTRVPSPATIAQSEDDATLADPDRYQAQPGVTDTDPIEGEATDLPMDENVDDDELVDEDVVDGVEEEFTGFEDISERPRRVGALPNAQARQSTTLTPTVIHRSEAEQEAYDMELVPIVPRINQQRVNIGGQWYNFIKGMEQYVPRAVADHIRSKGLI
jgi:hypothetical protein